MEMLDIWRFIDMVCPFTNPRLEPCHWVGQSVGTTFLPMLKDTPILHLFTSVSHKFKSNRQAGIK